MKKEYRYVGHLNKQPIEFGDFKYEIGKVELKKRIDYEHEGVFYSVYHFIAKREDVQVLPSNIGIKMDLEK